LILFIPHIFLAKLFHDGINLLNTFFFLNKKYT
jgi:hypothetical protein